MTLKRTFATAIVCVGLALLAGCSGPSKKSGGGGGGGGYYKDDGPGSHVPANIEAIPDAVPRLESHARANFRPYVVFGRRYTPISNTQRFRQEGTASWYGRKFHGNKTANGEIYDMYAMTAAHPTLPIPSYARVTRASTGKSVIVRVNDRGPFHSSRIIDLSYVAAAKLDLIKPGSGQVIVEAITADDIKQNRYAKAPAAAPLAVASTPTPQKLELARVAQPLPNALDALQAATISDDGSDTNSATTQDAALSAHEPGIYLQFGAFSALESADQLALAINRQIGQAGTTTPAQVQSIDQLHRVRIGPFPSRTAAVNASMHIQNETGLRAAIASR
jgi:rare lipoprotein A